MAAGRANTPLIAALGGSALLHLGVLCGVQLPHAYIPATQIGAAQMMTAHLVSAETSSDDPAQAQPATSHRTPSVQPAHAPTALAYTPNGIEAALTTPGADVTHAERVAAEPVANEANYYTTDQVDTPPRMLGDVQQIYPSRARSDEIEGFVTLALFINERGEVDQINVTNEQPQGYFEEAALSMLRNQRFSPALRQNQAVKSRWLTKVRYRLQDHSIFPRSF